MITPEEVGLLARPISQHIDHAQLSAYITEAEQLIIRPAIGDYLFGNVKVNTEYYGIILNGGKDVYGNVCGGLRKALAYYVYARFIKEGATIATRFGAVEKTDEYSARIEQDRKNEIYRECTAVADTYLQEVVAYAKTRGWMTANKVGRIRKTAYVIGDNPANEEESCYRYKSSNNGGNESGGAVGDIYAGEGINIKDNVISVDMAEVRSGIGVAKLESSVAGLAEEVEHLKSESEGEDISTGEGLIKDGSIISVDFSEVASLEALNEALRMANTALFEAQGANMYAEQALSALQDKADKTELAGYATKESVQDISDRVADLESGEGSLPSNITKLLNSKQTKLTVEVLPNGNIRIGNLEGGDKEFISGEMLPLLATKEEVKQMTETTASIAPNILHIWGEVASLNITLADGEEGVVNEYMVQFTSGATATTLTIPETIQWMSALSIKANKTYQLSIINNLGVIGEFGHE